jgi:hypothetical protein
MGPNVLYLLHDFTYLRSGVKQIYIGSSLWNELNGNCAAYEYLEMREGRVFLNGTEIIKSGNIGKRQVNFIIPLSVGD